MRAAALGRDVRADHVLRGGRCAAHRRSAGPAGPSPSQVLGLGRPGLDRSARCDQIYAYVHITHIVGYPLDRPSEGAAPRERRRSAPDVSVAQEAIEPRAEVWSLCDGDLRRGDRFRPVTVEGRLDGYPTTHIIEREKWALPKTPTTMIYGKWANDDERDRAIANSVFASTHGVAETIAPASKDPALSAWGSRSVR